jgi:hypothetical protein
MASNLNDIKEYILQKYTQFNAGYANVCKPDGTDIILDENKQLYAGIDDTHGNHFYIRDLKNDSYSPQARGARVPFYKRTKSCRIVAVYRDGDAETVLKMLINSISAKRHTVTRSYSEPTQVFKEETGKKLTNNDLTIVAVDFEVVELTSVKDCSLNPCNC